MVAQYTVMGRQVGSHVVRQPRSLEAGFQILTKVSQLAMLTLGTTFAGTAWAMSGTEKTKEQGPPLNAGSKDEEQFIQYVQHD